MCFCMKVYYGRNIDSDRMRDNESAFGPTENENAWE